MKKIGLIIGSLLVTSCMTYDPYTDDQKVSNSTKGAVMGGIAGAILGNQVKGNRHTRNNAQIAGVALGALAGGAIGNNMDKKEAALRHKLRNSGVGISRNGDEILLNMPGNITFDSGSSTIKPEFSEILANVAIVLKEYSDSQVEISGHCDNWGNIESNQVLSQQRANAVASYLRMKGVNGSRITATGYGKSSPTSTDKAQNRRVEIMISG